MATLPPEIQKEIIFHLERRVMQTNRDKCIPVASSASDFSKGIIYIYCLIYKLLHFQIIHMLFL